MGKYLLSSLLLLAATVNAVQAKAGQPGKYAVILTDGRVLSGRFIINEPWITIDSGADLYQFKQSDVHQVIDEASQSTLVSSELLLRAAPDSNAPTVDRLAKGQAVVVLQQVPEWVKVQVSQKVSGWLRGAALTRNIQFTPLSPQAHLTWPAAYDTRQIELLGYQAPPGWQAKSALNAEMLDQPGVGQETSFSQPSGH